MNSSEQLTTATTEPIEISDVMIDMLQQLAEAWRSGGATAFRLRSHDQVIWSCGDVDASATDVSCADVRDHLHFCLEVAGLAGGPEIERRLAVDLQLVLRLAQFDQDLELLTQRLIESQDQLIAVSELARAVRYRSGLDQVMEMLVEQARDVTSAQAAVAIVETADLSHSACAPNTNIGIDLQAALRYAMDINRPILLSEDDAESWPPSFASETRYRRIVLAPIHLSGRVAGGLLVLDRRADFLTTASRHLVETVAVQAEAMLELTLSAERMRRQDQMQRDAELARTVQRNLMPKTLPSVPGIDLATRYRPAAEIGGDLFECVLRPDGRLAVVVADVSGKGTSAALLMAAARTSVRGATLRGTSGDAGTMLRRVTEDLSDDLSEMNRFVTLFLGVIDPVHGRIELANCGHSPVIASFGGEPARLVDPDAPPIGVTLMEFPVKAAIPFEAGDVLVIATDGFSEAVSAEGTLFGHDRLLELVEAMKHRSASEIAQALTDSVDAFSTGVEQSDDQALIVVKRRTA